jgi:hypothetical protein
LRWRREANLRDAKTAAATATEENLTFSMVLMMYVRDSPYFSAIFDKSRKFGDSISSL